MSFHFFLSSTKSLHLLTPSTWRSLATSSLHSFLGLPLLLVRSSSWVKIFLGNLSSSILSRWPNQLILCPFIHFTIFSPLLISSSSRFVRLFHSPFSYLGPCILLKFSFQKLAELFILYLQIEFLYEFLQKPYVLLQEVCNNYQRGGERSVPTRKCYVCCDSYHSGSWFWVTDILLPNRQHFALSFPLWWACVAGEAASHHAEFSDPKGSVCPYNENRNEKQKAG